jgi:hypothetical protein
MSNLSPLPPYETTSPQIPATNRDHATREVSAVTVPALVGLNLTGTGRACIHWITFGIVAEGGEVAGVASHATPEAERAALVDLMQR